MLGISAPTATRRFAAGAEKNSAFNWKKGAEFDEKRPNHSLKPSTRASASVRFNAQDERNVMAAIHGRRVKAKKRARRLNLAFAAGLLLLLVLPVSAFTLHTRRLSAVNAAAPGEDRILSPDATPEATAARSPLATANAAASGALTEQDAIQAARTCFETLCDTSIFSFDEYTVSCERTGDAYTVLMTSIYGNGCTFSVTVDALSGQVIHHSAADLATHPIYLSESAPEVQSWYDKYGSCHRPVGRKRAGGIFPPL